MQKQQLGKKSLEYYKENPYPEISQYPQRNCKGIEISNSR